MSIKLFFMEKKNFLDSWKGKSMFGRKNPNTWKIAEGSSLSEHEKKCLYEGQIVVHPKRSTRMSKVFVMDELNNIWSVIIPDDTVESLKRELLAVGYIMSAA